MPHAQSAENPARALRESPLARLENNAGVIYASTGISPTAVNEVMNISAQDQMDIQGRISPVEMFIITKFGLVNRLPSTGILNQPRKRNNMQGLRFSTDGALSTDPKGELVLHCDLVELEAQLASLTEQNERLVGLVIKISSRVKAKHFYDAELNAWIFKEIENTESLTSTTLPQYHNDPELVNVLQDAPHWLDCDTILNNGICTCWKSAALKLVEGREG